MNILCCIMTQCTNQNDGVMISYGSDADSLFSGQERVQQTPVGTMTLKSVDHSLISGILHS